MRAKVRTTKMRREGEERAKCQSFGACYARERMAGRFSGSLTLHIYDAATETGVIIAMDFYE